MFSPPARSPMTSPGLSPTFRHARSKPRHSPVEIKEKMRKSYKERIQNSRNVLFNNVRGAQDERSLRNVLSLMLVEMFGSDYPVAPQDEEYQVYETIKEELVQDEMNWLLEQYEKNNLDNIDWASVECTDDVICLTCQKVNLVKQNDTVTCPQCKWNIKSKKTLSQIRADTNSALEIHGNNCNNSVQFTRISDLNEEHIYLICEHCSEIRLVL